MCWQENSEVIGAISIVPENETDNLDCWKVRENAREFARVVVRPDCQQQGLSFYLVDGVIRELKEQHTAAIHIAVAKSNIPAQKLYRKMGFDFAEKADLFGNHYFSVRNDSVNVCRLEERRSRLRRERK